MIRYGWLRVLFSRAEETDEAAAAPGGIMGGGPGGGSAKDKPQTTSQLLEDAQARLAFDLAQAGKPAEAMPAHAREQAAMQQVLGEREFRGLNKPDCCRHAAGALATG